MKYQKFLLLNLKNIDVLKNNAIFRDFLDSLGFLALVDCTYDKKYYILHKI